MNATQELIERIVNMTPEQLERFLAHPTVIEVLGETKIGHE